MANIAERCLNEEYYQDDRAGITMHQRKVGYRAPHNSEYVKQVQHVYHWVILTVPENTGAQLLPYGCVVLGNVRLKL